MAPASALIVCPAKVIEAVAMTKTCPAISSILSLVRMIVPAGLRRGRR